MIKYIPLLSLFFVFLLVKNEAYTQDLIERTQLGIKKSNATAQNQLAKLIAQNKQSSARFNEFAPFEVSNTVNSLTESHALGSINLTVKPAEIDAFIRIQPDVTTLKIPVTEKNFFELEIFKVDIFSQDFIYRSSEGEDLTAMSKGVFYRGIVKGDNNSIVSVSIFGSEIRILIGDDDGNYVIGKLKNRDDHVLYNDRNLNLEQPETCVVGEDQDLIKDGFRQQVERKARNNMAKCIPIYVECDYDMYQKHNNSEASVIAFVSALINEVATIYANEQIEISLSDLKVWTTTDPYASLNGTNAVLQKFGELTKNDYNGRLAHFISTRSLGGGIAWIDVLCSEYFTFSGQHAGPYAVSANMGTSITTFPTYSWNVQVFAHEMGHNMGSNHTQNCSWNGNNTAIDACSPTEGGCASTFGPCPPGGGTIMSYCNVTNCGIDFNNGFGPQPGDLIRSRYNNAACTLTCAAPTCDDGVQNGDEDGIDCGGSSCNACPCYVNDLNLSLTLDNYPQETSWTITNSAGTILQSGSGYTQAGATISQSFNLPPASGYTFTINDAYSDGICCGYGNGSFSLMDNNGASIAFGGAFGASFSATFCTENNGGSIDNCPNDPNKTAPGVCGCGTPDTDSDNDNTPDCRDNCPNDPNKTESGDCGCGTPDEDANNNGTSDCLEADLCPEDLSISSNIIEGEEMNAQKTISTLGQVTITENMTFKAGTSIILNQGFHAQAGSSFSAIIQSCTPTNGSLHNEVGSENANRIVGHLSQTPAELKTSLTVMPNPFRGETVIQYNLGQAEHVLIQVMDVNGRIVQILENQTTKDAGINEARFSGDGLDAGMYYVFLVTPTQAISKKIILMK